MSFLIQLKMTRIKLLVLLLFSYNCFSFSLNNDSTILTKVIKRALEKSHEKPQAEKWMDSFFGKQLYFDQTRSLVNLISMIAKTYLSGCTSVILYDSAVESSEELLLEKLFREYPNTFIHGKINSNYLVSKKELLRYSKLSCVNYILIMEDVMRCKDVIGPQNENKVVIVAKSSQWRVYEFLANEVSQSFVNLLVIALSEKVAAVRQELPYILYTHNLYIDGLGSSTAQVLTSWIRNGLTRSNVNLFPSKIKNGFSGHRFIFALANQPPYVIKRERDSNDELTWEGTEIRLAKLLAELYNFTTDFRDTSGADMVGGAKAVIKELRNRKADIGMSGIYIVPERMNNVDISYGHSQDCAAFISLASIALSKWRAIMGPFQWTVWLCLTLAYLLAIFPLVFSDRHSLRHLIESPEEIENMFWYVFGTFTNCFSFSGARSWSKTNKLATRILIGFYWMFTIILTACYTGSIIAFVTLPVFPETIDTVKQLISGRFQIGTLDKGGWQYWFKNSSDPKTLKLLKNVDLVESVEDGIHNITAAFFWSYAFLGSRSQLDYVVRKNFTTTNKKSLLHISSSCFVPFRVGILFRANSIYKSVLNEGIIRAVESGFLIKFQKDVEFELMRSSSGRLLQANGMGLKNALSSEDRALALQDTQGMFLLLSVGFVMGGISLISEWFGGCVHLCKMRKRVRSNSSSINSNPRSYDIPTPRQKLDSIQYSRDSLVGDLIDEDHEVEVVNSKVVDEEKFNNCDTLKEPAEELNVVEIETEKPTETNDINYDEQINKIFNFEQLFGEESSSAVNGIDKIDKNELVPEIYSNKVI